MKSLKKNWLVLLLLAIGGFVAYRKGLFGGKPKPILPSVISDAFGGGGSGSGGGGGSYTAPEQHYSPTLFVSLNKPISSVTQGITRVTTATKGTPLPATENVTDSKQR